MKRILLRLLILFLFAHSAFVVSAQDSSHIRISLLTCAPGDELYSTFGHSALRIIEDIDNTTARDIVYNYGTFNFNDEGFYLKFIRGKLLYYVTADRYEDFIYEYQLTNRTITEQVLDFSPKEKSDIISALKENLKEENKFYKYDFFLDNCTTRLRDIIVKNRQPAPQLPAVMPENFRFRQAIHQYLDKNKKYWSKLGIDILLGARCDWVMTTSQQQFLPDNLMIALDSTKNMRVVLSSHSLYGVSQGESNTDWFTPVVFFSMVFAVFFLLGLSRNKRVQGILAGLDGVLFFLTGLLGIILIFMWVGTDHVMTKNNFNLLWALPTHLIISFFINSKKRFVKKYFLFTSIASVLLLAAWFFLPQQMNNALIPFVLLILFRSAARYNAL